MTLLKLTTRDDWESHRRECYVPVERIRTVTGCKGEHEGHACLWFGATDYMVVEESAEVVAKLLAEFGGNSTTIGAAEVELEHFVRLAKSKQLPSDDTINAACRLLGLKPV
jgi:hypothetical protein